MIKLSDYVKLLLEQGIKKLEPYEFFGREIGEEWYIQ